MIDVVMPQMGESIVEGTLTRWLKKPGDKVERDEPLFEISTDKVDTEIPSPASGTLGEILVQEGATVGVNTVVGRISDGASPGAPAAPPAQAAAPQAAPPPPPPSQPPAQAAPAQAAPPPPQAAAPAAGAPPAEEPGPLSPLVRKMARENNIDLSQVRGTGAGGRITKQDLENYIAARAQAAPAQAAPQAPPPQQAYAAPQPPPAYAAPQPQPPYAPPAPVQTAPQAPPPPPPQAVAPVVQPQAHFRGEAPAARVEPMSIMRQKIAEHMVFSKHTSAHVTTVHKVDLTFLPFIVRAACAALQQFPIVNASIDGTNIVYHRDINIGIAVALENGLIVPVIRNADEKNVVGLQRSIADLASRARSRQLRPDEVQGGTFSITNFGSFGSVFATPVINQPQVAILGVGSVEKVPVVVDDAIAIRSVCYLALTFDHRLIDGALGDQFTQKVKSVLESWSEEIL
jgi:pyruvate dehydrogenase E2 component (dihydrolipoamide acetyltransferase)